MLVPPRQRDRHRPPWRGSRRRAIAAFALGILASAAVPGAAVASSTPGLAPFVPVRVLVAAGSNPLPLTDAEVRVVSSRRSGRPTTFAVGHTYGQGLALASPVRGRQIPQRFTVRTSGGFINGKRFRGSMMGEVNLASNGAAAPVIVNLATTLSAMYCRRHPKLATAACERRTAQLLDIPPGLNLGTDQLAEQYVSARKLIGEARHHGGLLGYLPRLVRKMNKRPQLGAPRFRAPASQAFVGEPLPGIARLRGPANSVLRGEAPLLTVGAGVAGFFGKLFEYANKAKGAVTLVNYIGDILGFAGSGESAAAKTSEELEEMNAALNKISSQLAELKAQIAELKAVMEQAAYSTIALDAAKNVEAIADATSSYQAVVQEATQISCGEYSTGASKRVRAESKCSSPVSPSEACTAAAEAANEGLHKACVHLGDLPLPPNASHYYSEAGSPAEARHSLIGEFIWEITQNNPFNDSDIQSLAADTIGVGGTDGIWQYGSSWLLREQSFLDTTDDKQLQGLVGYYLGAYAAGLTMRSAYYGFEQIPATTYESAIEHDLGDYLDLVGAAPSPLPAGTVIELNNGTMWSGQMGSIQTLANYKTLAAKGASITLPQQTDENGNIPNNAPGSRSPALANGETIANWAAADNEALGKLASAVPSSESNKANYLADEGVFSGQLLSNSSHAAIFAPREVFVWPSGMGLHVAGYEQEFGEVSINGKCTLPGGGCFAPTWASGEELETFDLASGNGMVKALGAGTGNVNWLHFPNCKLNNFKNAVQCEADYETHLPLAPGMTLPVLYDRTPVTTGKEPECYYYPPAGSSNACRA